MISRHVSMSIDKTAWCFEAPWRCVLSSKESRSTGAAGVRISLVTTLTGRMEQLHTQSRHVVFIELDCDPSISDKEADIEHVLNCLAE